MALLTLFFNKPKKTSISRVVGGEAVISLDAMISEGFTAPAEATNHPVEDGADVSDHVVIRPKKLSIEGVITNTPLGLGASIQGAVSTIGSTVGSALGKTVGGALGAVGGGFAGKTLAGVLGQSTDRSLGDVIDEFVAIRDAKQEVNIQTGLTQYKGYLLVSFTARRDQSDGGNRIRMTLEFQELIKATSKTEIVAIPKVKGALAKSNLGRKAKQDLDADKNKKGSSFANNILFGGK